MMYIIIKSGSFMYMYGYYYIVLLNSYSFYNPNLTLNFNIKYRKCIVEIKSICDL